MRMKTLLMGLTLLMFSLFVPFVHGVTLPSVEYTLPYPGILPDHPLYFFKTIRDAILEFLIVDPVRKSEFYILQADKRLVMAQTLVGSGKETLVTHSVQKAGEYEGKAYGVLSSIKSSGRQVPPYVIDTYVLSLRKHIEELTALGGKASETGKEMVGQIIIKDNDLLGRVGELK